MKYSPKFSLIILLIYLSNIVVTIKSYTYISNLIYNNLPFRESYNPSIPGFLYIYIFPIILGFLCCSCFSKNRSQPYYYFNVSVFFGLLNSILLFFLQNLSSLKWLENMQTAYFILLIPILYAIGSLPYYAFSINNHGQQVASQIVQKSPKIFTWSIAIIFSLLIFAINLIPTIKSGNLIGADIYYHAPMTRIIKDSNNIFQNPFFKEGTNYYLSSVYYVISLASVVASQEVSTIWRYYPPVASSIFIFIYFVFILRIFKSTVIASIATLFIVPFYQIMLADPSIRTMSYLLLMVYLLILSFFSLEKISKIGILSLLSVNLFILTMHTEIGIHSLLITFLYFSSHRLNPQIKFLLNKVRGIIDLNKLPSTIYDFYFLKNPITSIILLMGYATLIIINISNVMSYTSYGNLNSFNEIPLSLIQPIGPISFLCFIGLPYGIFNGVYRRGDKDRIILSLFLLSLTGIFYFTHTWVIYHRYLTETAYLGIAAISSFFWLELITKHSSLQRIIIIVILLTITGYSLLPKYTFITQYVTNTDKSIDYYSNTLTLISNNSDLNSVILASPDDIINRYIPWFTRRYIFSGASIISRGQQWQVLPFCSGPFYQDCKNRQDLSRTFFQNPSKKNLIEIRANYRVDDLLINKKETYKIENLVKESAISPSGESDEYILFNIRN